MLDYHVPQRGLPSYLLLATATVLNLLSASSTAYIVFLAVSAIQWRGAENLAQLGLLVLGVPLLFVQLAFVALAHWCLKNVSPMGWRKIMARTLALMSFLLPVLSGVAVAIGHCVGR